MIFSLYDWLWPSLNLVGSAVPGITPASGSGGGGGRDIPEISPMDISGSQYPLLHPFNKVELVLKTRKSKNKVKIVLVVLKLIDTESCRLYSIHDQGICDFVLR